jgi:hypothetical protein
MPILSKSGLQRWYRDSNSILKKLVAKLRYRGNRTVIRSIRLAWFFLTLPRQAVAWAGFLFGRTEFSQSQFSKIVKINPWVVGALPGLIKTASINGNIEVALFAALKHGRLHQKNHGHSRELLDEYLVGEPNWLPISDQLRGSASLQLDSDFIKQQMHIASRPANYVESSIDVIVPEIAAMANSVSCRVKNQFELEPILVGIALSESPLQVTLENSVAKVENKTQERRLAKFQKLLSDGLIVVKS